MDLSIIIPAYNARNTICATLDSIKNQNLSISFEVIVVNDCSDYNYEDIITTYNNYFKIREIKTPKNVGPGGARQFGIDNSSSEYIAFIDSDDYFYGNNSISRMHEEIKKFNSDLLIGNFIYQRGELQTIKRNDLIWLHGKMYKRKFLIDNNIKFNNTRANEDNGFNRLILLLDPVCVFLDEIVYVYSENPNSITRSNNYEYKFTGIEGFCYNMNWAMDEALLRGNHEQKIVFLALDVLAALYIYYLALEKEYDVNKILLWGKNIKEKYCKYQHLLQDDFYLSVVENKKEFFKEDFVVTDFNITFEEFLNKM